MSAPETFPLMIQAATPTFPISEHLHSVLSSFAIEPQNSGVSRTGYNREGGEDEDVSKDRPIADSNIYPSIPLSPLPFGKR